MSIATLLDSYKSTYNITNVFNGLNYTGDGEIDLAVINSYTCAEDLWRGLSTVVPKLSKIGSIAIPVYYPIAKDHIIPYPVLIAWLFKAFIPQSCVDIINAGMEGAIILIRGVGSGSCIPITSFYLFSDTVNTNVTASIPLIQNMRIINESDISWVKDNISTSEVSGPVDVVFTLAGAASDTDNEELRLALRSIDMYAENVGNIWVITDNVPKWLTGVNIIPVSDTYTNNKDANLITKLLAACDTPDVSDRFIYWSDDQVLCKKLDLSKHTPIYNPRSINGFPPSGKKWVRRMRNTMDYIHAHGGDCSVNWDSHVPQPIDKNRFSVLVRNTPFTDIPGFCINTLYFGLKGENAINRQDMFKNTYESDKVGTVQFDKTFIGYNDSGYDNGVREALLYKFQDPCKYEKK